MSAKNGGTAFPCGHEGGQKGMTLRDYFAAAALPQALEHIRSLRNFMIKPGPFPYDEAAKGAYCVADAMLKAREAK